MSNVVDLPCEYATDQYMVLRHGGGGAATLLVCGAVRFDHPAARELVALLPTLLHLGTSDWTGSIGCRPRCGSSPPRRPGFDLVAKPASPGCPTSWSSRQSGPGSRTTRSRRPDGSGALREPRVGRAISLIHRHPARAWTLAAAAREVAMSRSAFAARFTEVVGEPAMSYLARRRMHLALDWLSPDGVTVGELADRPGYQSEAAFSRAFKRVNAIPPGAVRRESPVDWGTRNTANRLRAGPGELSPSHA